MCRYPLGQSPLNHTLENADHFLGFNRGIFTLLLQVLFPGPIIQRLGRPRLIDEKFYLVLVLFVKSRMAYNNLCWLYPGTMFSHCNGDVIPVCDETCLSNA